ncbi:MAG: GAF domain-containing protein [Lachnospiraceae bacterium]|nr:GAF domain-containing protein [Lachnospiraceae bacterium]
MSKTDYKLIAAQVRALAEEEPFYVPLLSNVSALLFESLPDVSWAGFYMKRDGKLVLGPFQGKPACIHIPFGKGVCGTSFSEDRPVRVENVHLFPGHIACDSASNSEIVLPIRTGGEPIGVLDLDSTVFSRFSEEDEEGLQLVVKAIEEGIRF